MLKRLDLPDCFLDIPAHRRGQDFKALDDAIGVDNKPSPGFYTGIPVVNSILSAYAAVLIRQHGKGDVFANHFRNLVFIPHFMDIDAVHTN